MGLLLNCGSGQRPFAKPWINIDCQERWKPDLVADCAHLPYEDGSCDMIVLHHVLEHFGCGEGFGLIAESFRLLQPGGTLLIFVPDLKALAQHWLLGRLDTQIYVTSLYGAYMGDDSDRHKWGFDWESLRREVERQVWSQVKPFDWRKLPGADIAGPDFWIIGMEAIK